MSGFRLHNFTRAYVPMFSHTLILASSAITASAVHLTFYQSDNCASNPLYGGEIKESLPCYSLSKHVGVNPGNSSTVRDLQSGQEVLFYSDTQCGEPVYSTTSDGCFLHPSAGVNSFQVVQQTNETGVLAVREASSEASNFALSPYKGLATVPEHVDLGTTAIIIGAAAVTAAIGWTLQFVSTVRGCKSAYETGDAVSIENCNFDIGGTVATMGAGAMAGVAGYRMRGRFQNIDGSVIDLGRASRRDLAGLLNQQNEEYMAALMNVTGSESAHVGYLERDIGNGIVQNSPVWTLSDENGSVNRVTAFHNHETGEFVHSVFFGKGAEHEKRAEPYQYDSLRDDDGGFDYKICEYNDGADRSQYSSMRTEDLYNEITGDLRCLISAQDLENSHALVTTFYNGGSTMLAQMFITPFAHGGDGTYVDRIGTCGQVYQTTMEQTCDN